jgi:hypothetical protein
MSAMMLLTRHVEVAGHGVLAAAKHVLWFVGHHSRTSPPPPAPAARIAVPSGAESSEREPKSEVAQS